MERIYEPFHIKVTCTGMGRDLNVTVSGGDRPHIGSIAVADPRESLTGDGSISATVSVFNFTGHKDGGIAEKLAGQLAAALNRRVVVTAGVHIEHASPADLQEVFGAVERIASDLKTEYGTGGQ